MGTNWYKLVTCLQYCTIYRDEVKVNHILKFSILPLTKVERACFYKG